MIIAQAANMESKPSTDATFSLDNVPLGFTTQKSNHTPKQFSWSSKGK